MEPTVRSRRLEQLYDAGYLQRRFEPNTIPAGLLTTELLYLLDRNGRDYLVKEGGYEQVDWKPRQNEVGVNHLLHLIAINDFRIAMTCSLSASK